MRSSKLALRSLGSSAQFHSLRERRQATGSTTDNVSQDIHDLVRDAFGLSL